MKQRHVPESSLLRSMATVTFELLRDFCNGLRYGFIVLNPINSNVHVVFFNVLLASARRFDILKVGGGGDESTTPISSVTKEFSPWLETVVTYEVRAPEAGWISLSTRDRCLRPAPAQVVLTLLMRLLAFDPAAIKFRGVDSDINFTVGDYEEDMKHVP
uniref:Uncharacterized protein n=1 Tax=Brassica oleracea var. oleracea TaxID=109376 RepID=A0A0D3AS22_BRAOL